MKPKVIEAPIEEPITIAEARAHLESQPYDDSDVDPIDDAAIEGMLGAARELCEAFIGLSLSTRTLEIALDHFPPMDRDCNRWPLDHHRRRENLSIELPMGPVREIVSITVPPPDIEFDSDDVDSDQLADAPVFADGRVNPDTYVLDNYSQPSMAKPVAAWPGVTAAANAVKVRYLAGYGVDSDGGEPLPKVIRSAVLIVLANLRENRGDADSPIPPQAEWLMRPLRVRLGMA